MRNLGITIAGITFIVLMIKIGVDPDNKGKYIKLTKHLIIATILITSSLTIVNIPKYYFGTTVEITDGKLSDMTFDKIEDKDCQNRETINIDGKRYVVTDEGVTLCAVDEEGRFSISTTTPAGIETGFGKYKLKNCSILRLFSESQGTFKGFFADVKYYRDSDGIIFPATATYGEYLSIKKQGGSFGARRRWWRCKIIKQ